MFIDVSKEGIEDAFSMKKEDCCACNDMRSDLLTNQVRSTMPIECCAFERKDNFRQAFCVRKQEASRKFATLLGNSNQLSLSQRKLAAENWSHYFQAMNPNSVNSEFDS